jgi:hypothetical protein
MQAVVKCRHHEPENTDAAQPGICRWTFAARSVSSLIVHTWSLNPLAILARSQYSNCPSCNQNPTDQKSTHALGAKCEPAPTGPRGVVRQHGPTILELNGMQPGERDNDQGVGV